MQAEIERAKDRFIISTDKSLLQTARMFRLLAQQPRWEFSEQQFKKAIDNSICFGVYDWGLARPVQIGFARVITDRSSFACLCDLYIEESFRGQGLEQWLMEFIEKHPDLQGIVQKFFLAPKDADQRLLSGFTSETFDKLFHRII